eukprot:211687-Amphidinium_carterae.1
MSSEAASIMDHGLKMDHIRGTRVGWQEQGSKQDLWPEDSATTPHMSSPVTTQTQTALLHAIVDVTEVIFTVIHVKLAKALYNQEEWREARAHCAPILASRDESAAVHLRRTQKMVFRIAPDCPVSRKSTSGVICQLWGSSIVHYSRTQAIVAQRSPWAELYALTSAANELIHLQFMELGIIRSAVHTDSASCKAMVSKLGMSKTSKHIELTYLHLQSAWPTPLIRIRGSSSVDLTESSPKPSSSGEENKEGSQVRGQDFINMINVSAVDDVLQCSR